MLDGSAVVVERDVVLAVEVAVVALLDEAIVVVGFAVVVLAVEVAVVALLDEAVVVVGFAVVLAVGVCACVLSLSV